MLQDEADNVNVAVLRGEVQSRVTSCVPNQQAETTTAWARQLRDRKEEWNEEEGIIIMTEEY